MFDWQTEEDNWDDEPLPEETAVSPRRRSWWMALILILVVGVAGWVVYREITQRIESVTANTESDVLASHALFVAAVESGDNELFHTLISGRDARWATAQRDLAESGLLLGRRPFGFTPADDAISPTTRPVPPVDLDTVTMTLNPQFDTATLVYERPYTIQLGNNVTATVSLQQTAVYRHGTQRWLYAPPDSDFWGERATYEGRYLQIDYPARDEAIVSQLAPALDHKLDELCQRVRDLTCPANWEMRLTLSTNPDSMVPLAEGLDLLSNGRFIELPTPTLVGLPVDEAGFQALYRGYAGLVLTSGIADLIGYDCCRYSTLFQAMVDFQLADLGLRPSPINPQDVNNVLLNHPPTSLLLDTPSLSEPHLLHTADGEKFYALIHFLRHQRPDLSLATMQKSLNEAGGPFLWAGDIIGYEQANTQPGIIVSLDEALFAYLAAQAEQAAPPPIPFPNQVVQAVCQPLDPGVSEQVSVYQLTVGTNEVRPLLTEEGVFMFTIPLADDSVAVMPKIRFAEETDWYTYLWRGLTNEPMPITTTGASFSFGESDPTQQYLVSYQFTAESEDAPVSLIDLAECTAEGCAQRPLTGIPRWSPDGRQTIVAQYDLFLQSTLIVNGRSLLFNAEGRTETADLYLGDAQAQIHDEVPFAHGYAPFWLTADTLGYLQTNPDIAHDYTELVIQPLDSDQPEVVAIDRFTAVLPTPLPSKLSLELRYVIPHPQETAVMFVVAYDRTDATIYIFSYDRQQDEITLHLQAQNRHYLELSMAVSPDGAWLVLTTGADARTFTRETAVLQLHHIASQKTERYSIAYPSFSSAALYDWSQDGQWFIMQANGRGFLLLAPDHDYAQFIPYELGSCTSLAWLNAN